MSVSDWLKDNSLSRWAFSLWKRWGKAFVRLYIYSVLIYLPLIVLRLTNSMDGMWDQDDHVAGTAEMRMGRWFWPYLDRLRFEVSMDPIQAMAALAIYVTGVLVMISMLRTRGRGNSRIYPANRECCCRNVSDMADGPEKASVSSESTQAPPVRLTFVEYICAALMLTTPAVLCQLSYSHMAITSSTGFLFSILAVWVIASPAVDGRKPEKACGVRRQILWILLSALLIALMMGLYQAFLGVTCIVALAYFIYQLDGPCGGADCCIRQAFRFVLRMLIALVLGAVLYQILLQIHLTALGQTMSDYNGADSVSVSGVLTALPSSIAHCFRVFKIYFFGTMFLSSAMQLAGKVYYLLYLVPAAGAVLYAAKLVRAGNGVLRLILLALSALLIPVFASSYFLLATDSDTMMQMTSGLSLVIPLILLVWDHVDLPWTEAAASFEQTGDAADVSCTVCSSTAASADGGEKNPDALAEGAGSATECPPNAQSPDITSSASGRMNVRFRIGTGAVSVIVSLGAFLLLYGQIGQVEIDQYAMYVGRRATTTLAESVLNEYAAYGVDYENSVVFIYGAPADSPLFAVGDLYYRANDYAQYGNWGNTEEANRLCWYYFFRQQMRVKLNYAEGDTLHDMMTSELVDAMTVFPSSGSVQNVWGVTVVKVAE